MRTKKVVLLAVGIKGMVLCTVIALVYMQSVVSQFWFDRTLMPDSIRSRLQKAQKEKQMPDLNIRDDRGRTGLMAAIDYDDVELVKILLDFGADPNVRDTGLYEGTSANTALHRAAYHGSSESTLPIIELLLRHGANPRMANDHGLTPLHLTTWITDPTDKPEDLSRTDASRRLRVIRLLVDAGGDINARDILGKTLLHRLIEQRDSGFIKDLIVTFPSLINRNVKSNAGFTPLEYAINLWPPEPDYLIEPLTTKVAVVGADGSTQTTDDQRRTGLMLAIMRNDKNGVEKQIANRADLQAQSLSGNTPLHYAVLSPDPFANVITLLAQKANPNAQNNAGNSPLHLVVLLSDDAIQHEILKRLVEAGGDLGLQNRQGDTLLHLAVENRDKDLIETMMGYKDSAKYREIKNKQDYTAYDRALYLNEKDILKVLLSDRRI